MGLFTESEMSKINEAAKKSNKGLKEVEKPKRTKRGGKSDIDSISKKVEEYFKDSEAILISSVDELHEYIDKCIEVGYCAIDTETTGLDRQADYIVGFSLYYPGGHECYIPNKHLIYIFDEPCKNQVSYEDSGRELQRLVDAKVKMIFANADYDIAMIWHDFHVDMCDVCYYDVILAWRCLKENELHNGLKALYNKYVLKGKGDPKKFTDFFSVDLFPYCKPSIAKLYAANDARITYDLFRWQLPYTLPSNEKCKKNHLEGISEVIWNLEFPMIKVCAMMNRDGIYFDKEVARKVSKRYHDNYDKEISDLRSMVQDLIDDNDTPNNRKRPFKTGYDFNPTSPKHVQYLCYDLMKLPNVSGSTDKGVLRDFSLPQTDKILKVRSLSVLINSFIDKLTRVSESYDGRIHPQFKSVGADTGRMSSSEPNAQNIPSHATDIRHMFRATPGYVMFSSDYSQQEPKLLAVVSHDPQMCKAFSEDKDIYATIASVAFNKPYEQCLEFNPITGENQPEGKERRTQAKSIVLGITYGRSTVTIGEQLFGKNHDMSDEDKTKAAQKVYDSVLRSFPHLKVFMEQTQESVRQKGYAQTILGRRRHIPDMQLPRFEFKALPGYVNPDIDPLDVNTLQNKAEIPQRVIDQLTKELNSCKYYGQVVKKTKELYTQHIKVINNTRKITDATRQCVNSVIQGSAADLTKMAILNLESNKRWKEIGGRLLVPVHDELICEVPMEYMEEGRKILQDSMEGAGDFMPFKIRCDVETSLRWYGLSYPCEYDKPESFDIDDMENLTDSEIEWIQYHILESEYKLPVYPDKKGNAPIGDAAKGLNGQLSDELVSCIKDYEAEHHIDDSQFINHIETLVEKGTVEDEVHA